VTDVRGGWERDLERERFVLSGQRVLSFEERYCRCHRVEITGGSYVL
jgi:hypothetical protein